jgi:hypothetical protein
MAPGPVMVQRTLTYRPLCDFVDRTAARAQKDNTQNQQGGVMSNLTEMENGYFVGGNSPSRRHGWRVTAARAGIACLMSMVAAIICAPLRARAATVIATITGTVEDGYDYTGTFIAPDGNLAGYPFTLVFTMDDTQGIPFGTWPSCDNGLQSSGLNTPVPKAVLTINGRSYTFGHPHSYFGEFVRSIGKCHVTTNQIGLLFRRFFQYPFSYQWD